MSKIGGAVGGEVEVVQVKVLCMVAKPTSVLLCKNNVIFFVSYNEVVTVSKWEDHFQHARTCPSGVRVCIHTILDVQHPPVELVCCSNSRSSYLSIRMASQDQLITQEKFLLSPWHRFYF